ncbi:maleylacetoacetate isomerase [Bowmanella denitrificans]|uniref:Maleylacetoacetate isomerase n=1 Tax=Bowmanella denitrificans TaxID=366582 RepID=A0ABN0XUN4_9ALTE
MLALYHEWDSLMSFKVRACLAEKQLAWQSRRVSLRDFEHLRPAYLALNPAGVVPTLVHNQQVICESSHINEYLDQAFQPSLVSERIELRDSMRSWCGYFDEVIHPTLRVASFQLMIRQRFMGMSQQDVQALIRHHPQPARAQAFQNLVDTPVDYQAVLTSIEKLYEVAALMEQRLQQTLWLAGNGFSLADIASMALLDRIDRLGFDFIWRNKPALAGWIERVRARPTFSLAACPAQFRMPAPRAEDLAKLGSLLAQQGL